jgi:superfamily II DNA or RNA helicase
MQTQLRPHQLRAISAMKQHRKGQIIKTTGAGKTLSMVFDAVEQVKTDIPQTIVVVCPRILLASQLCSEFTEHIMNAKVFHVHSGDVSWDSSTNPSRIMDWMKVHIDSHKLIFTTYHSLIRLQQVELKVDTIYFDEAHNSIKASFFPSTEYFSQNAGRCYFFTATRRTSMVASKPGMNDAAVYGNIICRVSAPELVNGGYIVPPVIKTKKFDLLQKDELCAGRDCNNVIETIDETDVNKILVCVKTSKQLIELMGETDFANELKSRGYSYLYITSKTGAIVNGNKVRREDFFNILNTWGKDPSKKFVVLHRSILSEGISVNNLEAVVFLRNMDTIEMVQTIGRVLRTSPNKSFGLCVVPVYSNVGIATERALQQVVNTVFGEGELLDSVISK